MWLAAAAAAAGRSCSPRLLYSVRSYSYDAAEALLRGMKGRRAEAFWVQSWVLPLACQRWLLEPAAHAFWAIVNPTPAPRLSLQNMLLDGTLRWSHSS